MCRASSANPRLLAKNIPEIGILFRQMSPSRALQKRKCRSFAGLFVPLVVEILFEFREVMPLAGQWVPSQLTNPKEIRNETDADCWSVEILCVFRSIGICRTARSGLGRLARGN